MGTKAQELETSPPNINVKLKKKKAFVGGGKWVDIFKTEQLRKGKEIHINAELNLFFYYFVLNFKRTMDILKNVSD